MGVRRGTLRVGTSGYVYDHWKGRFYPDELPRKGWFAHYADRFDAVEINNTFYRMPSDDVVVRWRDAAPPGFQYAFKASRYITHMKRLLPGGTYADPVGTLFERLSPLGGKLGPVLFQLAPWMPLDLPRLRAFLARLPPHEGIPVVFEFRHRSWHVDEVFDALGEHGVSLCLHDLGEATTPVVTTADLVYARFHGTNGPYRGLYGPERLEPWARRIADWLDAGRDVHAYFNNDESAYATRDATWLRERVLRGATAPRAGAMLLHASPHARAMAESSYSPKSRDMISKHIKKHKEEGMPQRQAVAAAMSEARRSGKKVPARKKGPAKKANRPNDARKASKAAKKAGRKSGGGRKKASSTRRGSTAQKKRAGAKGGRKTAKRSK